MKSLPFIFLIIMSSVSLFADQAAWITKEQAEKGAALIKSSGEIRHFCAPCGDNFYKKEKVTSVKAAKTESTDPKESYFEVIVNGDGVDLAYVYVLSGGKWLNAAMLLNIKVEGVSRLLPEDLQDEDAEINEEPIDDDLNNYNEPDELSIDEE